MNGDISAAGNLLKQIRSDIQHRAEQLAGNLALLPALITWSRFLAAIAIILLVYRSVKPEVVFWLILWGAVSDYLDGWLARRMKKNTYVGKVMDFTADKLFISVALITASFSLSSLNTLVASLLTGYHLLLLFSLAVLSWSVHVPLVTITTGERLAMLFSYLLVITALGTIVFPGKQIFRSLYTPLIFIAMISAITGLLSYLRLLRRILSKVLE